MFFQISLALVSLDADPVDHTVHNHADLTVLLHLTDKVRRKAPLDILFWAEATHGQKGIGHTDCLLPRSLFGLVLASYPSRQGQHLRSQTFLASMNLLSGAKDTSLSISLLAQEKSLSISSSIINI